MSKRNLGSFTASREIAHCFSIMKKVQKDIVIISAEYSAQYDRFKYFSEGPPFEPVECGYYEVPEYDVVLNEYRDGDEVKVDVKFIKKAGNND